jgi:hypothetical protein
MARNSVETGAAEVKLNGGEPPPSSPPDLSMFDDLDRLKIADPAQLGGDT